MVVPHPMSVLTRLEAFAPKHRPHGRLIHGVQDMCDGGQ